MHTQLNHVEEIKNDLEKLYDTVGDECAKTIEKIKDDDVFSLDKFPPAWGYFYKRKINKMFKLSRIKKNDHILEVGCTVGHITFPIAEMGYKITAIDISPKCIEMANKIKEIKSIDNPSFFVSDAEDLSVFPDNCFDAVFSFSVIRYVPNPVKALKEMYRVVKKDGAVVVDFPNKFCPWFKLLRKRMGFEEHIHDHVYSASQVKKMFNEAGFNNIKATTFLYVHKKMPNFLFNIARPIGMILESVPFIKNTAAIIMCRGIKN